MSQHETGTGHNRARRRMRDATPGTGRMNETEKPKRLVGKIEGLEGVYECYVYAKQEPPRSKHALGYLTGYASRVLASEESGFSLIVERPSESAG
jgi:hypothetical protein